MDFGYRTPTKSNPKENTCCNDLSAPSLTRSKIFSENRTVTISQNSPNRSMNKPFSTSLSMKLRAEAVRVGENDTPPNIIRTYFPSIQSPHSRSLPIASYELTAKDNALRQSLKKKLQYSQKIMHLSSKLSGIHDNMALEVLNYSTYPDRSKITQPTSLCVRCSVEHSVLCMDCCETQLNEAIRHEHIAVSQGAFVFFDRAIIRGAEKNLTKFIVFTIWKNYLRRIKRVRDKLLGMCALKYRRRILQPIFDSLKLYLKEKKITQQNTMIEEFKHKIASMEKYTDKLRTEKNICDSKLLALSDQLKQRDKAIEDLKKQNLKSKVHDSSTDDYCI